MNWVNVILLIAAGDIVGFITGVLLLRSKLKEANAAASKAETAATDSRFDMLQKQINSMEELYRAQGDTLNQVRKELLDITKQKLLSDKKVNSLEVENSLLKEKVERLEKEVNTYKTYFENK